MSACSLCHEEGHNAKTCPERGPAAPKPLKLAKAPKRAAQAAVSSTDTSAIKDAVIGVVDALERVPAEHRDRVMRSATLILGGDAK